MARPYKFSPTLIAEKADKYIEDCKKKGISPLLQEFALELGVNKDTLTDWQKTEEYSEPIKKIKAYGEISLVRKVEDGSKPIGPMFLLKTNHGYVEKQHDTNINLTLNMGQILDQLEGKETRRIQGDVVDIDPPTTPIPPLGEGDEKNDTP